MNDEAETEAMIHAAGKTAPRVTPASIDAIIVAESYWNVPDSTVTVCALKLRNGFVVTGESAAASPENYDPVIGIKIARENARNKIWAFEGYLLRQRLHEAADQ